MNCSLTRKEFRQDGIFGEIHSEMGELVAVTLEHAYPVLSTFMPKIPPGTYTCRRGMHRLHGMTEDFETFEITGILGHTNLLFHWGNFNKDSEGCVLIGDQVAQNGSSGSQMILNSRATFKKFMKLQEGVNEFQLVVE